MKNITKDIFFSERLRSLIKDRVKATQNEFCKTVGITQGYLSMVLNGKRGPSADLIIGIYLNYGEHFDWLLKGDESKQEGSKDKSCNITKVIIEHQDLVKRFKNPEKAKEINEDLLLLEDIDKDGVDEVHDIIKMKLERKGNSQKKPPQPPHTKRRKQMGSNRLA